MRAPQPGTGRSAGFEQRALGHRDSIVLFDDMSHLPQPELAKLVTFRLASNRPKTKAGQYVLANNIVDLDWRVITLSTSEDPIWQQMIKPGRGRVRGEEVRMINVRACVSDKGDIFDGPNADARVGSTLEERLEFVEKQEKLTQDYQGEAFRSLPCETVRGQAGRRDAEKIYGSILGGGTPTRTISLARPHASAFRCRVCECCPSHRLRRSAMEQKGDAQGYFGVHD